MIEVSFLAAFLGGVLSLLSPCSALLLPAFFAYAFQSGAELVRKTGIFYLGLAATLVPLGMGISAVSSIFYGHRSLLIVVSGLVIAAFGVLQIAGRGFSIGPIERLRGRIRGESAGATFALGAVYGFAGFCSGPILGAVLTVAASSGAALQGAALLATYTAGMSAPLLLMALLWDRFDLGHRRWLRGREFSIGKLSFHTTGLISGLMFILLGVAFIAYQGTSALSGFYESNGATDLSFAAEQWINGFAGGVSLPIVLLILTGIFAALYFYRRLRRSRKKAARAGGKY